MPFRFAIGDCCDCDEGGDPGDNTIDVPCCGDLMDETYDLTVDANDMGILTGTLTFTSGTVWVGFTDWVFYQPDPRFPVLRGDTYARFRVELTCINFVNDWAVAIVLQVYEDDQTTLIREGPVTQDGKGVGTRNMTSAQETAWCADPAFFEQDLTFEDHGSGTNAYTGALSGGKLTISA